MPLLSTSPSRSPHYHWITGNLQPLSPELNLTDEELPDPSSPWDTLFDPLSSQDFLWHRDTLQRDDDDLDSVPLHGVVSYGKYLRLCMRLLLKVWRERWDEGSGRVYYWNVRTGETCWEQPGEFWGLGLTLDPLWTLYPLLPEGVVGQEDHHQRNHLHFHRTHHNHHLHHHHHLLPHPPHTYTHCVHRVTGEVVEFEGEGIKEEGAATKLPLWVDAWRKGASQWTHDLFFAHGEWLNRDTGERCTNTPDEVLQAKERGGGGGGSKLQQALGRQHQYHQQPVMVSPKSGADGIKQGQKLLLLHQQKQQQQQHGSPFIPSSITATSELPPPAMPPNAPLLSPYEVELYRGLLEEEVAREDRVCDMGTIYLQDGAANGLGRGALGAGGGGEGNNNYYGEGSMEPHSSGTTSTTLHTQHTITVKLDPQVTSNWEKDWDYHAPPTLPSLLSNPASSSLSGGGVVGEGVGGGGSPKKTITGRGGHGGSSSSSGGGGGGGTPSTTPLRLRHHHHHQPMGLPRTPSARALQGLPPTPTRTHYPDLHGYLYKRGGGTSLLSAMSLSGGVGWKRRFFVSHGGILTYYTSEEHFTAGEPPLKRHGLDLFHYRVMDQSEGGGGDGMVGEFALVPRLSSYAVLSLASGRGRAVGAKSGVGGVEAAGASSSDGRGGGSGGDDAHHHHHHHHYTLQGANPDRAFYLRVGEEEGGELEVAALAEAWKVGLRGVVEEGGSGGGGGGGGGGGSTTPPTFSSSPLSPYYLQSITGEVRGDRAWMAGPSSITTANTANTLPSVTAAAAAATATAATNNIGSRAGVGSGFDAGGVRVDSRTLMAIGGLSLKWVAGREALEGLMGGNDGGAAFTNTYAPFREKHPPQIKLNPVRDLQEEQHQEKQQRFKAAAAAAAAATGVAGTGTGMGASRRESMSSASSVAVSASGGRSPAIAAAAAAVVYSPGSIPPPPPSPPPLFAAATATSAASPSSITITQPVAMIRMSPPPPPPGPPPPHAHPDYYFHASDSVDGRRQRDRREEEEEEEEQQEQEQEGEYEGIRDDLSYPLDDVPSRVSFSGDGGGDMDGSSSVVRRRETVVAAPVANGDTAAVATGGSGGGGVGVMSGNSSPPPPRKPYLSPLSAQQAATKRNSRFSWGAGGGLPTGTTLSAAGVTTTYSLSGAYAGGEESRYEGELGVGESVFVKTSGGQVKFSAEVSPTAKDTAGVRRNRHYLI